jgi:Mce-associated membrane protein
VAESLATAGELSSVDTDEGAEVEEKHRQAARASRIGWTTGLVMLAALLGVGGWLGLSGLQAERAEQQRAHFLEVGRQGAINLTTIDWQTADADVQRILDSATGSFYDDFSKRAQSFVDVVKQAQSRSVGTVVNAGVESESGDEAQVLVAMNVETSNSAAAQQDPRRWRMRVSVQRVGDDVKVSPRYPLAQNVAGENIDRAAQRWIK